MKQFDIVFGDDFMALYKDGELVAEGVRLTFGDIIEHLELPTKLWTADIEWADRRTSYPKHLGDVMMEMEEVSE
jgi:hypothetical protein